MVEAWKGWTLVSWIGGCQESGGSAPPTQVQVWPTHQGRPSPPRSLSWSRGLPEPHPAEWRDVCLRAPIPHLHAQTFTGKAALGNFVALWAQNFKVSPRKEGEFKGEAPDLAHFPFGNWKDFYEMTFLLFFSRFIRCHSQDIDIVKPAHHLGQSLLLNRDILSCFPDKIFSLVCHQSIK